MLQPQVYESKKLKVSAIQYTGENGHEIYDWTKGNCQNSDVENIMIILTKEGSMLVSKGDYVVKEPFPTGDRDFYPVKAAIFEKRYQKAGIPKADFIIGGMILLGVAIMCFVAGVMFAIWYANH